MLGCHDTRLRRFVFGVGVMIANRGDDVPVSTMPCDGTFPTGTTQYEKRSIAQDIPIWDPAICTQCGLCRWAARTPRSA